MLEARCTMDLKNLIAVITKKFTRLLHKYRGKEGKLDGIIRKRCNFLQYIRESGRERESLRQTRHCTNSALVFLSSALFFLNSTLFFLNSVISLLYQLISFLTPPFLDSVFSRLSPFPTFKESHVAGLSRHRYRSWGTTQNELIGGKNASWLICPPKLALFVYPPLHFQV